MPIIQNRVRPTGMRPTTRSRDDLSVSPVDIPQFNDVGLAFFDNDAGIPASIRWMVTELMWRRAHDRPVDLAVDSAIATFEGRKHRELRDRGSPRYEDRPEQQRTDQKRSDIPFANRFDPIDLPAAN